MKLHNMHYSRAGLKEALARGKGDEGVGGSECRPGYGVYSLGGGGASLFGAAPARNAAVADSVLLPLLAALSDS